MKLLVEILEADTRKSISELRERGVVRLVSSAKPAPKGWVRLYTTFGGMHSVSITHHVVREWEARVSDSLMKRNAELIAQGEANAPKSIADVIRSA